MGRRQMSNKQRDRRQTSRAQLALRALWETVKEIGAAAFLLVIAGWGFWLPLLLIADKVMAYRHPSTPPRLSR